MIRRNFVIAKVELWQYDEKGKMLPGKLGLNGADYGVLYRKGLVRPITQTQIVKLRVKHRRGEASREYYRGIAGNEAKAENAASVA